MALAAHHEKIDATGVDGDIWTNNQRWNKLLQFQSGIDYNQSALSTKKREYGIPYE